MSLILNKCTEVDMIMEKSAKKLDLERKSEQELKDLLENQEKLLHNKTLMMLLPDGGKKVEELVDSIRRALNAKNSVEDTAIGLNRIRLATDEQSDRIDDDVLSGLQLIMNRVPTGKIIVDERKNFSNSYEFIMKQNCKTAIAAFPEKFTPHKLLGSKTSEGISKNTRASSSTNPESMSDNNSPPVKENVQHDNGSTRKDMPRRLKHRYDASLEEMFPYERQFARGAKVVSLEESVDLLNKHQTALKEAELKRAETMLAANNSIRLSADQSRWDGEKFDRYRDEDRDTDKDDDENEDKDADHSDDSDSEDDQ